MGVMVVIMVAAFLGYGRHNQMMGGHGKESHNEATVEKKETKDEPCTGCPVEKKKNGGNAAEEVN
jgi:hypothetical protein